MTQNKETQTGHPDRIIQELVSDGRPANDLVEDGRLDVDELVAVVAFVLQAVRDDIVLEEINGRIRTSHDVERFLNARIKSLTGFNSITGDTTERAERA